MFATLAFCFVDCPDLPAGIAGIKLIEPVLDASEVIVHTVGVDGVVVVVDGDVPYSMLGENKVDIHPRQRGVAAKPGQILCDNDSYLVVLHRLQHFLESGSFKTRSAPSVIYLKAVFDTILFLQIPFYFA